MKSKSKLVISIGLLLVVISIGVGGYMTLSDDNFIDSLYMTIITMTTVGFGEIHPLTYNEKLFTIFLILISIMVYGYTVTALTEYLASGKILEQLKQKKVQQKIQNLKNHTVVCGYGRNGKQAVAKLIQFNQPCVVIEKRVNEIAELEKDNILFIEGDATNDDDLAKLGLERAKSLITALPSDADNLFVVLSARQFNKDFTIISRASNESSYGKLKFAGATNVIMPDKLGGAHMASLVVTPDLVEFVDRLTIAGDTNANLEEISVNDLPSELLNKTILDLDLRKKTGCNVIGFKTSENEYIVNPESSTKLTSNTNLIVLGNPTQIKKLRETL
ncbi:MULTISPECIES: potassium channel family protein [Flavobacteriaceae]|uniref:Potassium channel protein n=2 Tax=Flavobacteriaceae TaxID=49546 RepID=A0A4Y8AV25_9FLAO|nr:MULTISPECIES: potassium channel protein [Flavobacteriaceae]TEW75323.1 potassium channel protein [Gramella jeungdoensis]GGK44325.1 potassium transporter TrkA [Lutibacter litoralis]